MHAIERHISSQNWITLTLIFALTLIAILRLYNPKRLYGYFFSFYLKTFFQKKAEENSHVFTLFNFILLCYSTTILSLIIGILVFKEELNLLVYIYIFLGILSYISARAFIDLILEKLIHQTLLTQYFRHTKSGYFLTSTIWLFPILVIYLFQWENHLFLLIASSIIVFSRLIFIILKNKKLIFGNIFYFILYICTLKIAPMLIIYKLTQ